MHNKKKQKKKKLKIKQRDRGLIWIEGFLLKKKRRENSQSWTWNDTIYGLGMEIVWPISIVPTASFHSSLIFFYIFSSFLLVIFYCQIGFLCITSYHCVSTLFSHLMLMMIGQMGEKHTVNYNVLPSHQPVTGGEIRDRNRISNIFIFHFNISCV